MTDLCPPRTTPRQPRDFVGGCGIPAPDQTSGRSCAGVGAELSCQLCPASPNYFKKTHSYFKDHQPKERQP